MSGKNKKTPADAGPAEPAIEGEVFPPNLTPAPGAHVTSVEIEPDDDPSYGLNLPHMSRKVAGGVSGGAGEVSFSDSPVPLNGEIRVTTAAYCYDGRLAVAPPWIDRNWLGNIGGPVLYVSETDYEVPEPQEGVIQDHPQEMIARVGDWVVREDAILPDGRKVQGRLKVVRKDEADRLGLVEKTP